MVAVLGRGLLQSSKSLGSFLELMLQSFVFALKPPFRFKELIQHIYFIANESAPVVLICVSFAASVTIIESSFHMKIVIQNDSMVPGFASLLILRELGSVVSCLLVGSRVGAGWAAQVGTMKVTEQIDALKLLGIQPVQYLVAPRLLASIIGCFTLAALANLTCLYVAMWVSNLSLGYTTGNFISTMNLFVSFKDLFFACIKGACFGVLIPLVSCYCGFRCEAGAEGVGKATTQAVVIISVGIIIMDFVLTWFFSNFY